MTGWCTDPHIMNFVDSLEKQIKEFKEKYPNDIQDVSLWLAARLDDITAYLDAKYNVENPEQIDHTHLDWALNYYKNGDSEWLETIIRTNANIARSIVNNIEYVRNNLQYLHDKLSPQ